MKNNHYYNMEHYIQKFYNWINEQHFTLFGRLLVIKPNTKYIRTPKKNFLILLGGILILLATIYFHPTQEVMTCDQNIQCSIRRTYFNIYTYVQKINFKPEYIEAKTHFVPGSKHHPHTYNAYLILKDHAGHSKSPFVFYYKDQCHSRLICANSVKVENSRFLQYKNNPYNEYTVKSEASQFALWFWLIFIGIFVIALLFDLIKIKR